jgi:hypothetical protein
MTAADPIPPTRRRRSPRWLPRVLVESALIVFSVLLALALNEWRSTAAQRQRLEQAVAAVRSELQENRRLVADALAYHERLSASFAASAEAGAGAPDLDVVTQGLLAPARVLRTAWASAQHAGLAAELPYATILQLSTVYAQQEEYETLSRAMLEVAYARLLAEGFGPMLANYRNFVPLQQDFAGRERVLLQYYDRALATLH